MAITYMNGFGALPMSGDRMIPLTASNGTVTYSRQTGRYGGYAVRATNSTSSSSNSYTGRFGFNTLNLAEFSLGFALNHRSSWSGTSDNVGLDLQTSSGSWVLGICTGFSNGYSVGGANATSFTVVDSSPTSLGWHWWNFLFRSSGTVGICELYRDGVLLARANGDTLPTSGLPVVLYLWVGNSNGGASVDVGDLVWRDDAVTIPDTVVTSLFPDGTSAAAWVGSDGDSTDNHLLINENPTYDPATYVASSTVGATDIYTVANLPGSASSVSAVQTITRAFKSDAGARAMTTTLNGVDGPTVDPGGGAVIYRIATTNPAGGAAWDTASVNAMTAGVKVVS